MNKLILIILVISLTATIVVSYTYTLGATSSDTEISVNKSYKVIKRWKLPKILSEISGMSWISNNEIATIQDELGTIFIYNLEKEAITNRIKFTGPGDFEGISISNQTAYALRSDGMVFIIKNFLSESPQVKSFPTLFNEKNNMESLSMSHDPQQLFMIPKDKDLASKTTKGIYLFNVESGEFNENPSLVINLEDPMFKKRKRKNIQKTFRPSDIEVHPITNDIYITDGVQPGLLILDKNGALIRLTEFSKKDCTQPEGITFAPDGTMYISNETNKKVANILEIELL